MHTTLGTHSTQSFTPHIHTHTHTHTLTHTHTHAHTHALTHTHTLTHIHTHTHTGLVADCPLTDYVPSSCAPTTTANDGLWTSILVGAESFRYHVTKDITALNNAWKLVRGMQFLNNVRREEGRERGKLGGGV